jgi:hypothetical protein
LSIKQLDALRLTNLPLEVRGRKLGFNLKNASCLSVLQLHFFLFGPVKFGYREDSNQDVKMEELKVVIIYQKGKG